LLFQFLQTSEGPEAEEEEGGAEEEDVWSRLGLALPAVTFGTPAVEGKDTFNVAGRTKWVDHQIELGPSFPKAEAAMT